MASPSANAHVAHGHDGHGHDGHGHDHDDGGPVHVHIAPAGFYWGIFGALIVLTFLTVAASYVVMG